ncbi:MAG: hypothetical protein U5K84_10060 [Alkalibacterium sp.]|nr:hypothetical protein [Alkalibacterium sp.]
MFEATVHNEDGVEGTAYVEGENGLSVTVSSPTSDKPGDQSATSCFRHLLRTHFV